MAVSFRPISNQRDASGGGRDQLPDGLTHREAEVLRFLACGLTNRQIADQLVLSTHTIERHVANAYAKIRAHNRVAAALYTVQHGL
jgi:DNA-binding NarL/FixJ family response regulator